MPLLALISVTMVAVSLMPFESAAWMVAIVAGSRLWVVTVIAAFVPLLGVVEVVVVQPTKAKAAKTRGNNFFIRRTLPPLTARVKLYRKSPPLSESGPLQENGDYGVTVISKEDGLVPAALLAKTSMKRGLPTVNPVSETVTGDVVGAGTVTLVMPLAVSEPLV